MNLPRSCHRISCLKCWAPTRIPAPSFIRIGPVFYRPIVCWIGQWHDGWPAWYVDKHATNNPRKYSIKIDMTHRCNELHSDTNPPIKTVWYSNLPYPPNQDRITQLHSGFINQKIIDKVPPQLSHLDWLQGHLNYDQATGPRHNRFRQRIRYRLGLWCCLGSRTLRKPVGFL